MPLEQYILLHIHIIILAVRKKKREEKKIKEENYIISMLSEHYVFSALFCFWFVPRDFHLI